MQHIAAIAERLRLVRRANRKFLQLSAIDRAMIDPLIDRLAYDLEFGSSTEDGPLPELVDPLDPDAAADD